MKKRMKFIKIKTQKQESYLTLMKDKTRMTSLTLFKIRRKKSIQSVTLRLLMNCSLSSLAKHDRSTSTYIDPQLRRLSF